MSINLATQISPSSQEEYHIRSVAEARLKKRESSVDSWVKATSWEVTSSKGGCFRSKQLPQLIPIQIKYYLGYYLYSDGIIAILMVYIKLSETLHQKIKNHLTSNQLITCANHLYIPYPEFSTWSIHSERIALTNHLEIHKDIGREDIITYSQMD